MDKKYAYITLLTTDSYIYFLLALLDSFEKTHSKYPIYVCVTNQVSNKTINIIKQFTPNIIKLNVDFMSSFIKKMEGYTKEKYFNALAKLGIFKLYQFNKCVYLDADLVLYKNVDELFNKPNFAAVEDCAPAHVREYDYKVGASSFCSGMFVFEPTISFYNKLVATLQDLETNHLDYKWHDQAVLAYMNQDWMQRDELHLHPQYDLLIAKESDPLKKYLKKYPFDEIKIKHFVAYKKQFLEFRKFYMRPNVFREYYNYAIYINSIIDDYHLELKKFDMANFKETPPVDIVITYLDQSDKEWQKEFVKYKKLELNNGNQSEDNSQAFGAERYRDWDNFKYWFRGVEKNCSWVNKVFLVVQSESQIPEWLNLDNPKLKVVYHRDFIPSDLLPTFGALPIEMYLSNIKELSNNFIYCNDDFFFLNKCDESQFFKDDKIVTKTIFENASKYKEVNMFSKCLNTNLKIEKNYMKQPNILSHSHLPEPRKKDFEQEILTKYGQQIHDSYTKSKFRHPDNYQYWLFLDILKLQKKVKEADPFKNCVCVHIHEDLIDFDKYKDYRIVCFNDTERTTQFEQQKTGLLKMLEEKFPKKSSFER